MQNAKARACRRFLENAAEAIRIGRGEGFECWYGKIAKSSGLDARLEIKRWINRVMKRMTMTASSFEMLYLTDRKKEEGAVSIRGHERCARCVLMQSESAL